MDLFYNQSNNIDEQIDLIKDDIFINYKSKRKPAILYTDGDINNSIFIIMSPINNKKTFNHEEFSKLIEILDQHEIKNYVITYSYIFNQHITAKKQIKDYSKWITKLIDVINPIKIVTLGEDSQLSLFRKKFLLKEFHGKIIGKYNNIPIYTTYDTNFYLERSHIIDISHKQFLMNKDWNNIKGKENENI